MSAASLMSFSAYARHRGCSPAYITQLKKQGKIPVKNGKIDPVAADAALGACADPVKVAILAANAERKAAAVAPAAAAPGVDPTAGQPIGLFNRAKTTDAEFVAKLRQVEYEERIGSLIAREAYAKGCEDAAVAARKAFEALQHRLAPVVAGETSVVRCRELIAAEVDRVCDAIADTLEALAAPPKSGTRQ